MKNRKGDPIPGAQLTVRTEARLPSYGFPVDEFSGDYVPQADHSGLIIVHHSCDGMEWGGSYDVYLGFIRWPLLLDYPKSEVVISADGYKSRTLDYWNLVKYEFQDAPRVGSSKEFTLSERIVVLKRRKSNK